MNSNNFYKSILVTGSNKGIGYGILRGLLQQNKEYRLILTSRNKDLGHKSLSQLKAEFPDKKDYLYYHQLDITDKNSIKECIQWIKEEFGQIDILVNNAGVAGKGAKFDLEVYDYTFPTNVYGTIDITETFLSEDLIRKNGKIVMIGSCSGLLSNLRKNQLQKEFLDENLNVDQLLELANRFREAIQNNTVDEEGWPHSTYSVSKMIVNVYPRVLTKRKEVIERNIGVFTCHPGWVKTDMAGPKAPLSIEEGVVTPIYVIELHDGIDTEKQGKYYDKCKITNLL